MSQIYSAAHLKDVMVFYWALHGFLITGIVFFIRGIFRR